MLFPQLDNIPSLGQWVSAIAGSLSRSSNSRLMVCQTLSTILSYLYFTNISIFCYFILLFHYSLEGNVLLFTPLD